MTFAPPLKDLGKSGIGVAAAPTGGMGFALDGNGKLPASVLPTISSVWPTGTADPGQEIVYQNNATLGIHWRFKYDPTQTTYPWLFIGGPPLYNLVDTAESTTSTTFADLATVGPSVQAGRAGEYLVDASVISTNGTAAKTNQVGIKIGSGAASAIMFCRHAEAAASSSFAVSRFLVTAAAGDVISLQYLAPAGPTTATFQHRLLSIIPVRVA